MGLQALLVAHVVSAYLTLIPLLARVAATAHRINVTSTVVSVQQLCSAIIGVDLFKCFLFLF